MLYGENDDEHDERQAQILERAEVGAVLPPPKAFTPTLIRLKPMESTTVPVTTAGKKRRRGFRKKPRTASNKPPMSDAPMMAP